MLDPHFASLSLLELPCYDSIVFNFGKPKTVGGWIVHIAGDALLSTIGLADAKPVASKPIIIAWNSLLSFQNLNLKKTLRFEISQIKQAIAKLKENNSGKSRTLSVQARKRIAAAQRKRWAAWKGKHKK